MSRRAQIWAWSLGGGLTVAVLALLTARNAERAVDGENGERPEARKAVMQRVLAASLPYRLAGLERREMLSGVEALQEIARLHGHRHSLTGGRVARYGETPGISVWAGQASSAEAARHMVREMRRGIEEGNTAFRLRADPEFAAGVVRASGRGREHAFFASGTQVVWVAAPAAALASALLEVGEYLPW